MADNSPLLAPCEAEAPQPAAEPKPESESESKSKKPQMDVYSAVRWSAVSKYGAEGVHVIISLVLARLLAPEHFGLLGMATVITGFINVFKNLGFASAVIQRKRLSNELLSTLFWVNMGVCVLIAACMAGVAPAASWVYRDPRVAPIVAVLSINVLMAGLTMIPSALLTRKMAFNKLAVREIAGIAINGATSITLALLGWGVWALVAGTLAGHAAQMILINLLEPFRPRLAFDASGLRECFGFGLNLTGANIFNYVTRNADNLIIGMFLGPVALGYYALAYKLMLLPRDSITNVVTRVLFPAFSRMQDDDERLAIAYLRVCGAIAFFSFPMMAGLAVVARPFIAVVPGDKWLPALPLIWILAPAGALQSLWSLTSQVLLAKGRADWYLWQAIALGLLSLGAFLGGVAWGVTGVASAFALLSVAWTVISFWMASCHLKRVSTGRILRELTPYALSAVAMAGTVLLATITFSLSHMWNGANLLLSIALGVLSYGLFAICASLPALRDVAQAFPDRIRGSVARMTFGLLR